MPYTTHAVGRNINTFCMIQHLIWHFIYGHLSYAKFSSCKRLSLLIFTEFFTKLTILEYTNTTYILNKLIVSSILNLVTLGGEKAVMQ